MPMSAACNINKQGGNIANVCVCYVDQEFCSMPSWGIFTAVTLLASKEEQA